MSQSHQCMHVLVLKWVFIAEIKIRGPLVNTVDVRKGFHC